MLITKHNRHFYFFNICFLLPALVTLIGFAVDVRNTIKAHHQTFTLKTLLSDKYRFFNSDGDFYNQIGIDFIAYFAICLAVFIILNYFFYVEFDVKPYRRFIRGVKIASINYLGWLTKEKPSTNQQKLSYKTNKDYCHQLKLCGVHVPKKAENLHFLIAGSTGTGKSSVLDELILSAIMRGDKVIIIDPNGGFLSKFYQEGDHILNPYDARTENWDLFFEIKNSYDVDQLMKSIIPPSNSSEEWNSYARTLLKGILKGAKNNSANNMQDIIHVIKKYDNEELKKFVEGTEAEALFTGDGSNGSSPINSTRFVLGEYLAAYNAVITKPELKPFSIKDYIQHDKHNLFITWREDMVASLKPLISTWCDIVSSAILSSNTNQQILLVIDELDTLNQLPSLEHLATKGRKHGLNIVACIQSTAQLNATYGKEKAIALRSCFRNLVALGGSKTDSQTAEDISKAIGEHEVTRIDTTDSFTSSSQKEVYYKEPVVFPSELQSLKNLDGYLAFAQDLPVVKFKIDRIDIEKRTEGFIEK
jgi:type IV secretory pathway TraG/TraD family ATPase VirD4